LFAPTLFLRLARAARRAALVAVLGAAGCVSGPAGPPAVLEWAEVVAADAPAALELDFHPAPGKTERVRLAEPVRFEVARASLGYDSLGQPGIDFQMTAADAARFRSWTGTRVGRKVAALVDREVLQVATVRTPLPGAGMIECGSIGLTLKQTGQLVERLSPR
jgi:hypothetical protein